LKKAELYPDLEWTENKFSYSALFKEFYRLGQVRYATHNQLIPFNKQVFTKQNLVLLTELGYLDGSYLVENDTAYFITDKTKELLTKEGFNVRVIQKKFTGTDLTHSLKITDCLLKLQGQSFFYAIFYPLFRDPPESKNAFLVPDACVVWKKDGAYKIEFIEVEEEKPDWENYLWVKKEKYERLARDPNIYHLWWKGKEEKGYHKKLILPLCKEADFCFSVICYANIKKDWGGWKFSELTGI